jgi:hypothetical protein
LPDVGCIEALRIAALGKVNFGSVVHHCNLVHSRIGYGSMRWCCLQKRLESEESLRRAQGLDLSHCCCADVAQTTMGPAVSPVRLTKLAASLADYIEDVDTSCFGKCMELEKLGYREITLLC